MLLFLVPFLQDSRCGTMAECGSDGHSSLPSHYQAGYLCSSSVAVVLCPDFSIGLWQQVRGCALLLLRVCVCYNLLNFFTYLATSERVCAVTCSWCACARAP